jgi:hypothetical protein
MGSIKGRVRQLYPATNKNIGVELTPMSHHSTSNLRPSFCWYLRLSRSFC